MMTSRKPAATPGARLCLVLAVCLPLASARAELLVHEPFEYPEGDLGSAAFWSPMDAAARGKLQVVGGSLSRDGLPGSTGGRAFASQHNDECVTTPVLPPITGGQAYYSALLRMTEVPAGTTYAIHFGGSRHGTRLFFKAVDEDSYQVGIANSGDAAHASQALPVGETVLVVAKFDFTEDKDTDEVSLFINPDPRHPEPKPDVVKVDRAESRIDQLVLRQHEGAGSYDVDEIRVGTSWDAVMGRLPLSRAAVEARERHLRWSITEEDARLKWNNPGLVTDAGAGLWGIPLPMDWDNDGDPDLLLNTAGKPSNGIWFYENDGSGVLKPGVRLAKAARNITVSQTGDGPVIMTPGVMHRDFSNGILAAPESIDIGHEYYAGRADQWTVVDWEGDGGQDILVGVSDWRDYGWDDAYNETGEWTAGPIHGHVFIVRNEGTLDDPDFGEMEQITAGGEAIDVYGAPSPTYIDWDGDGDMDLLCAEFLDRLTFFENIGSRSEPVFAKGRFLEHKGETIHLELQMLQLSSADWDQDGDPDLLVGKEDGRVVLIENEGGGVAAAPVYLKQRAHEVKVGALTTPRAVDWDGDGDTDILTGNTAGFIEFLENLGGDPPTWAPAVRLKADGQTIRFQAGESYSIQGPAEAKWGYTNIDVADWNLDGKPDIVVNTIIGKVVWFENVGTRTEPRLSGPHRVEIDADGIPPHPAWNWWEPEEGEMVTQWRTTPVIIDLTNDGKPDLVMQDHEGFLALYERLGDPTSSSLVSLPQRNFRVTSPDHTFIHNGDTETYDHNEDGVNDVAQRGEGGEIVYHARVPGSPDTYTRTESIERIGKGDRLHDAGEDKTLLRMNSGWAGRSGRRKFAMADWDKDGDLDLLVNSRGVNFLENIGSNDDFVFVDRGRIIPHILGGHSVGPAVLDLNEDGVLDLLVGAEDGRFYHYPRRDPGEMNRGE